MKLHEYTNIKKNPRLEKLSDNNLLRIFSFLNHTSQLRLVNNRFKKLIDGKFQYLDLSNFQVLPRQCMVKDIVFFPNREIVATIQENNPLTFRDMKTGEFLGQLKNEYYDMVLLDENLLAARRGQDGNRVDIWDVSKIKSPQLKTSHELDIPILPISFESGFLPYAQQYQVEIKKCKIFDTYTGKLIDEIKYDFNTQYKSFAFADKNNIVVCCDNKNIHFINRNSRERYNFLSSIRNPRLHFSTDEKSLFLYDLKEMEIIDIEKNEKFCSKKIDLSNLMLTPESMILGIATSDKYLAVLIRQSSRDDDTQISLSIFNIHTKELITSLKSNTLTGYGDANFYSLKFDHTGDEICFFGGGIGQINILEILGSEANAVNEHSLIKGPGRNG